MNVHVGDDPTAGLPAMRPQVSQPAPIDLDDARGERVRIDVVVEYEFLDPTHPAFGAKEESTAFASAAGALPQFEDAGVPCLRGADDLRPRPEYDASERCY